MDETQDQSGPQKPFKKDAKHLPKGGVRLSDLAKKRAQNLRDNLAKRKRQSRQRDEGSSDSNN